jgi:putative phosphoesterase
VNIFVLSDTHGNIKTATKMYQRLSEGIHFDMIIHCGDYVKDASEIEKVLGIKTIAVRGNCDGSRERDFKIVETPAGRILVTHGHAENVKFSLNSLIYLAKENECNIACFGHTHCAVNEIVSGIHLINPGSLTNPRDGKGGSCAIIIASGKEPAASIVPY